MATWETTWENALYEIQARNQKRNAEITSDVRLMTGTNPSRRKGTIGWLRRFWGPIVHGWL
jgi:hypothetical protein